MEQHPVPQNVTTFQFRLIGDMTLKQFGYLCLGAVLAYISYKLPLPFFFTWPMTVFFALLGIGFAFVPVEERPMDVWVMSFFKSIYSPTQYIWSRGARSGSTGQPVPDKSPKITTSEPSKPSSPPPIDIFSGLRTYTLHTSSLMVWLKKLFTPKPKTVTVDANIPSPINPSIPQLSLGPIPSVVGKRAQQPPKPTEPDKHAPSPPPPELAKSAAKSAVLEQKVGELEAELSSKALSETRVLELQKQLAKLLAEKQKLEEELVTLRRKAMAPQASQITRAAGTISAPPSDLNAPTIKVIDPGAATKAGLPKLTTYPNVVTGIIKDTTGNLLPGVLVTIRDREGVPLRAFKTNKLGQFAASTQLSPGTYLVEVEDPRDQYVFDRAQFVVNNTVLPPIEIIAKSQKELERAKLAQQIFGNQG